MVVAIKGLTYLRFLGRGSSGSKVAVPRSPDTMNLPLILRCVCRLGPCIGGDEVEVSSLLSLPNRDELVSVQYHSRTFPERSRRAPK